MVSIFFYSPYLVPELFKYLQHHQLMTPHEKTYDVGCVSWSCLRDLMSQAQRGHSWWRVELIQTQASSCFSIYISRNTRKVESTSLKKEDHHSPGPRSRGLAFWEFNYHLGKLVQEGASVQILHIIPSVALQAGDRAPWSFFFFFK